MTDPNELHFSIPSFSEWLTHNRVISSKPPFSTHYESLLAELLSYEADFKWAISSIESAQAAEKFYSSRYVELAKGLVEAKRLLATTLKLVGGISSEAIQLERILMQFDERFLLEQNSESKKFIRHFLAGNVDSIETVNRLRNLYDSFIVNKAASGTLEELLASIDTYDVMYCPN